MRIFVIVMLQELIAYAAWENHDAIDGWVPAACNTYLKIDLKQWLLPAAAADKQQQ